MNPKIVISGPPRCGKSTLISKLIKYYKQKNYIIQGFLTPEKRMDDRRIGFDILDINSGESHRLARIGNFETQYRLGKYKIFIDEFENVIAKLENSLNYGLDLIVIDEIGKMELFSNIFKSLLKRLFKSDYKIIATLGQKMQHPIKSHILTISNVILMNLNRSNQEEIFHNIISTIL